jgi:hypothetical protein
MRDWSDEGEVSMQVKWIAVTVVLAIFAFLTAVNGPLGPVLGWRPAPDNPTPEGIQVPFFILLGLTEAVAFGFGVAFLLFGYAWMSTAGPAPSALTRVAHLSIAWWLINWWSHDSFHIANGMNLGGLLFIEYGYHITLMGAGACVAAWFMTVIRGYRAGAPA